jgi:hypothetical protein
MDDAVEELVKYCHSCQLNGGGEAKPPIQSTEIPTKPWINLAMDFYGPLQNGKQLLVLTDEYSRYPYVKEVNTTGHIHVLPVLDEVFSLLGIPQVLKTDNGPPMNGRAFREFCDFMGVKHRKITACWPRANGQAENFMRNINKVMKRVTEQRLDQNQELNSFLKKL